MQVKFMDDVLRAKVKEMKFLLQDHRCLEDPDLYKRVQKNIIYVEMAKTAEKRIAYHQGEIFNWKSLYGKLDDMEDGAMTKVVNEIGVKKVKESY